jgi:hypothetical protein
MLPPAELANGQLRAPGKTISWRHNRVTLSAVALVILASLVLIVGVGRRRVTTERATTADRTSYPSRKTGVRELPERIAFNIKSLLGTGRRQRERDVRLVLGDGRLAAMTADDGKPVYALPYSSVTSIAYSHSRDPMWSSPIGPALVTHADGGVLGALGISVDRNWVSLGTSTTDRFIVFRVSDVQVHKVLSALEQCTGLTTQHISK